MVVFPRWVSNMQGLLILPTTLLVLLIILFDNLVEEVRYAYVQYSYPIIVL